MHPEPRASCLRPSSTSLFPAPPAQRGGHGAQSGASPATPGQSCPPLPAAASPTPHTSCAADPNDVSDRSDRSLSTALGAHVSATRPPISRAITAAPRRTAQATNISVSADSSRPNCPRAFTSTAALIGHPEYYIDAIMSNSRSHTSLLARATQVLTTQLELSQESSYAHRNAPAPPSNWSDPLHRRYLVRLWDAVEEKAAASKYTWTTTQRVVSTEKSMMHAFPELSEGDQPLARDWIEYVLGVALKHPFCTAEKMGRWEILASSGGARGTWGPW